MLWRKRFWMLLGLSINRNLQTFALFQIYQYIEKVVSSIIYHNNVLFPLAEEKITIAIET